MSQPNQRRFNRSSIDSPVEVLDIESGIGFRAAAVNVSDGGLSFRAPMEPALGADMYLTLGGESATPSEFRVVRIEPNGQGFTVAAARR